MSAPLPPGVLVFAPSYNDHAALSDAAQAVAALGPGHRFLVIDDGSHRPIDAAGLGAGVLLVRVPDNFGLGTCTHIAYDHALAHDYRAIVRIDADGQHPVAEIPRLLAPLDRGDADVVVGSRVNHDLGTGAGYWVRRLFKAYLAQIARLVTGGRAPQDVNTGFFAVNRAAAARLNGFALERFPEPQMFILACREGLRVSEVLVEQRPRLHGRSTLSVLHALRLFYRFTVFVLAELLRRRHP